MESIKPKRIASLDITRGLVMIIMALDHTRDYFHFGAFYNDPTNLETTTPILFFTRFITHYCAPIFIFLAGSSAFLYGQNKTKKQLSIFLLSRGFWLMLLEIALNNLIWSFDLSFSVVTLQVIWVIGLSFVFLSVLIYLPLKLMILIGVIAAFGHNLLDNLTRSDSDPFSIVWYLLHQQKFLEVNGQAFYIAYPVIPWFAVMALGYAFGMLYCNNLDPSTRRKYLLRLGGGCLLIFLVIRGINFYGEPVAWEQQKSLVFTIMSFFNLTKYPPSLSFLLITLGPMFLFLASIEKVNNKVSNFILVFGRVPLFYYFLHILVIHILAIIVLLILGADWTAMIIDAQNFSSDKLLDYGYPLYVTYIMWVLVIIALYFPCKKYMTYKANNKQKKWLSYL